MQLINIGIDLLMVLAAFHLISTGLAGRSIEPYMLILIGILIVIELITNLFHTH